MLAIVDGWLCLILALRQLVNPEHEGKARQNTKPENGSKLLSIQNLGVSHLECYFLVVCSLLSVVFLGERLNQHEYAFGDNYQDGSSHQQATSDKLCIPQTWIRELESSWKHGQEESRDEHGQTEQQHLHPVRNRGLVGESGLKFI